MEQSVLGIDVAKRKFDVALLINDKLKHKACQNTPEGFAELLQWMDKQGAAKVHACLEATGRYGEALAQALVEAGHTVSLVNPARVKGFAQSELNRTKTDKVDAALIARFCAALRPEPWKPLAPEFRELQALLRRLADLQEMRQMEINRLKAGESSEPVMASIQSLIQVLDHQVEATKRLIQQYFNDHPDLKGKRDLLTSIPGVGEHTAAILLAEIGDFSAFQNARQLVAYCGLNPKECLSGSSVRRRARLSKVGNSRLRKALFMPALTAARHNPILKAFAARLLERGKARKAVLGAVMRKLLHLAFGVLKHMRPFDANHLATA